MDFGGFWWGLVDSTGCFEFTSCIPALPVNYLTYLLRLMALATFTACVWLLQLTR